MILLWGIRLLLNNVLPRVLVWIIPCLFPIVIIYGIFLTSRSGFDAPRRFWRPLLNAIVSLIFAVLLWCLRRLDIILRRQVPRLFIFSRVRLRRRGFSPFFSNLLAGVITLVVIIII